MTFDKLNAGDIISFSHSCIFEGGPSPLSPIYFFNPDYFNTKLCQNEKELDISSLCSHEYAVKPESNQIKYFVSQVIFPHEDCVIRLPLAGQTNPNQSIYFARVISETNSGIIILRQIADEILALSRVPIIRQIRFDVMVVKVQ